MNSCTSFEDVLKEWGLTGHQLLVIYIETSDKEGVTKYAVHLIQSCISAAHKLSNYDVLFTCMFVFVNDDVNEQLLVTSETSLPAICVRTSSYPGGPSADSRSATSVHGECGRKSGLFSHYLLTSQKPREFLGQVTKSKVPWPVVVYGKNVIHQVH